MTPLRFLACVLFLSLGACAAHQSEVSRPLTTFETAQQFLGRNEPARAIPLLETLHRSDPSDLTLARALVEAHVKAGQAQALVGSLSAQPSPTSVTHYMLGLCFFARASDAGGPALEQFEKAIALAPQEAELHYRLGVALLESERYEQALPPLRRAIELAPERAGYALPLAKAQARTGDAPAAVASLRRALKASPSENEVKVARALMEQLSDPFAPLPKPVQGPLEKGLTWLNESDVPQQAIVAFEEILRDYPDLAVVHALLGLAYQKVDDAGRAVDELKRAIELAPSDGKNHLYLAQLYLSRQRPQQAKEHLERAIALNPLLDEAYYQLGDLALERRDLTQAGSYFHTLTTLQPDGVPGRGKLALVHQLEGNWPAADQQLKRILQKEPDSVEFKLRLGVLHTERFGRATSPQERQAAAAEASRWLQQVLQAQPDNALASRALESLKGK